MMFIMRESLLLGPASACSWRRSSGPRWSYYTSVSPLQALIAILIALQVIAPTAEAFSSTRWHVARRPGINNHSNHNIAITTATTTTTTTNNKHNYYHPPNSRPFRSKFFVTAGRSLNSKNNEPKSINDEKVPWECVIDPNCCDHCKEVVVTSHRNQRVNTDNTIEYGTWTTALEKREEDEDRVTLADKLSMVAFGTTSIAFFALLIFWSGPGSWRFFLAGGLCAAMSHAIPTPIDVVKTKKQVDRDLQELGFIPATKKIIEKEGIGALLAGLGPTIWGYLLEGAVKFGVYEVLKPATTRVFVSLAEATSLAFLRSQMIAFVVCGCVSGTAASIVLCPMEALRIRLVSEPDFAPEGWIQGGRRMIKREGVLSLWKGIAPQIYKQVPYTVTKNVAFDFFTKFAYRAAVAYGFAMDHATKLTVPLASAVVVSVLSCVSSQPGDMLLSLVNARGGEVRSTNDIARDILRSERGVRGFFVGLNERIFHVGIIVTLQLVLYDVLKRLCGGIATGAH